MRKFPILLSGITVLTMLSGCGRADAGSDFRTIQDRGELRVLTSPPAENTALSRSMSVADAEFAMLAAFAEEHGLKLRIIYSENFEALAPDLEAGRGDLIADNVSITENRRKRFDFTEPIYSNQEFLVIGGKLRKMPESPTLVVRHGTTYELRIPELQKRFPKLRVTQSDLDIEDLLAEVGAGHFDMTIADENFLKEYFAYRRDVKTLIAFPELRPVGWALPKGSTGLKNELDQFIRRRGGSFFAERSTGDLPEIRQRRMLRVLTRDNPVNYYLHRNEKYGFEYELAKRFAESQDLQLVMIVPPSYAELYDYLRSGKGDIIAASVTDTVGRHTSGLAFSAPYLKFHEVFAFNSARTTALDGATVTVRENTSYLDSLRKLQKNNRFRIRTVPDNCESIELLDEVARGSVECTLIDEPFYFNAVRNGVQNLQSRRSSDLTRSYVWVTRKDNPDLLLAVNKFFADMEKSGELAKLAERYFGAPAETPHSGEESASAQISPYDSMVKEIVTPKSFDWRFISAQICQESRFDSQVTARDGGMGLMQLMPATAREMKCRDPYDPADNVRAGAGYLAKQRDRLNRDIAGDNRLCFALASYNGGYGHVLDARILAAELGYEPDIWFGNVEEAMKLLKQQRYYSRARYGSCQSDIITRYVQQIFDRYGVYRNEFAY